MARREPLVFDATPGSGAPPIVGWRSWIVTPEPKSDGTRPLLTGLLGFPWRWGHLEAKCLLDDRDATLPSWTSHRVDRHHAVIPDSACSCGITAIAGEPSGPPWYLHPRAVPVVSGFVELSGRLIAWDGSYRAQRASITGPLLFEPPRPSRWAALSMGRRPVRVVHERHCYRIVFTPGGRGIPFEEWTQRCAAGLEDRYGVSVVALGPGAA